MYLCIGEYRDQDKDVWSLIIEDWNQGRDKSILGSGSGSDSSKLNRIYALKQRLVQYGFIIQIIIFPLSSYTFKPEFVDELDEIDK